ncbi:MAG: hypothetical protein AB1505_27135, partial [Candidatus Latescibacterota bacterium]
MAASQPLRVCPGRAPGVAQRRRPGLWFLHAGLLGASLLASACGRRPGLDTATPVDLVPRIDPDYAGLVIPPNIAPLNFRILEDVQECRVRLSVAGAAPLSVGCPDNECRMDPARWRRLLAASAGQDIQYEVYGRRREGTWVRFRPYRNTVAREPIDSHIVYRQLVPNKQMTTIRGIYQQSLETLERWPLVTARDGTFQCFNCHSFHQHDPNRFLLHIRGKHGGTLLVTDGRMRKVDTQQQPMFRPLAYASWHPDGRHVTATLNQYVGNFPATEPLYYFQAIEKRGDLAVWDTEGNTISTSPQVFGPEHIETHPSWSADGRYIYFARCADRPLLSYPDLDQFKFDLMRISYDAATDTW